MDRSEYRKIMATDFRYYDNTGDARFESMRNYPRRVQLYRKHQDLRKDYEHQVQYYRKYQKMFATETKLKKQKIEGRFIRMIKHTLTESPRRSDNLKFSYHQWTGESPPATRECPRVVTGGLQPGLQRGLTNLSGSVISRSMLERLPSHRSISVNNVPQATSTEQHVPRTARETWAVTRVGTSLSNQQPELMVRSMTAIDKIQTQPLTPTIGQHGV